VVCQSLILTLISSRPTSQCTFTTRCTRILGQQHNAKDYHPSWPSSSYRLASWILWHLQRPESYFTNWFLYQNKVSIATQWCKKSWSWDTKILWIMWWEKAYLGGGQNILQTSSRHQQVLNSHQQAQLSHQVYRHK
jgi:hypothetical protein